MNGDVSLLDRYVGSPIYGIAPEHGMAIVLVLGLAMVAFAVRFLARRGGRRSGDLVSRYRVLPSVQRLLFSLLAVSASMNLGMAMGRADSLVGEWLFAVAIAEVAVLRRLLKGRSWRRRLSVVMIVALTVSLGLAVAGFTVGQIGFVTALLEVTALAVVLRSVDGGRVLRLAASLTVIGAIGFTTLAGWGGAVVAGIGVEVRWRCPRSESSGDACP